jgi:hypothetical protein
VWDVFLKGRAISLRLCCEAVRLVRRTVGLIGIPLLCTFLAGVKDFQLYTI